MQTSATIKQRQYNPIQGTRKGNRWTFQSESRDRVSYTVERNGREYRCGCPATGLCKHITSSVLDDARKKFDIVQVWTSEADADRQHRRKLQMSANGKPFWVTFEERNPLKGVIRFCPTWGGVGTVDLFREDGIEVVNLDHDELVRLAESRGWVAVGAYHWSPEAWRACLEQVA